MTVIWLRREDSRSSKVHAFYVEVCYTGLGDGRGLNLCGRSASLCGRVRLESFRDAGDGPPGFACRRCEDGARRWRG